MAGYQGWWSDEEEEEYFLPPNIHPYHPPPDPRPIHPDHRDRRYRHYVLRYRLFPDDPDDPDDPNLPPKYRHFICRFQQTTFDDGNTSDLGDSIDDDDDGLDTFPHPHMVIELSIEEIIKVMKYPYPRKPARTFPYEKPFINRRPLLDFLPAEYASSGNRIQVQIINDERPQDLRYAINIARNRGHFEPVDPPFLDWYEAQPEAPDFQQWRRNFVAAYPPPPPPPLAAQPPPPLPPLH